MTRKLTQTTQGMSKRVKYMSCCSVTKLFLIFVVQIDELLDDLDANNDGFVNYEEFKVLFG